MSTDTYAHPLLATSLVASEPAHLPGPALSLYAWLMTEANARGIVCRESSSIAKSLDRPETEIVAWCEHLAASRLIAILTPPPHLVVKLPLWSGERAVPTPKSPEKPAKNLLPNRGSEESLLKLSYRSLSQAKQEATNEASSSKYWGDKGLGEGGTLLRELHAVIGDHAGIPELLKRYPEPVIRAALAKTRATPTDQIKKSRAALFWFLIGKTHK